jgi:glycosyltransferase A (GT-A) superfamily protein (DUF2064 family)
MRRCLVLFSRDPEAEARTKRLPGSEPVFATTLARVARAAEEAGFELLVAGRAARALPKATAVRQRGITFGERLCNALTDARGLGYEQVFVVPGDVPGLNGRTLLSAARALEQAAVVAGPSPDGGIYLLGLRGVSLDWIASVRWRTASVFQDVCRAACALGVAVLPVLADLDRARDLDRLACDHRLDPELRRLIGRARLASRPPSRHGIRPVGRTLGGPAPVRGPPSPAL